MVENVKCVKDIPRGTSYRTCGKFYSESDQETWKVLSRGREGLPAVGRSDLGRWAVQSVRKASGRSDRRLLQECTLDTWQRPEW